MKDWDTNKVLGGMGGILGGGAMGWGVPELVVLVCRYKNPVIGKHTILTQLIF